jgi:uncharacterized membrane protein
MNSRPRPRLRRLASGRAATLGFSAGLRTFTPLAVLSLLAPWRRQLRRYVVCAALIELAFDKLPGTPSRLGPLPLAGRVLSGATAAAAREGSRATPAGMISALLGAHVGAGLRRRAVEDAGWPDYVGAVLEDALALTMATVAAPRRRSASTFRIRAGIRVATVGGMMRREVVRRYGFGRRRWG